MRTKVSLANRGAAMARVARGGRLLQSENPMAAVTLKYGPEFKREAVARMMVCGDVKALAKELGFGASFSTSGETSSGPIPGRKPFGERAPASSGYVAPYIYTFSEANGSAGRTGGSVIVTSEVGAVSRTRLGRGSFRFI